MLRANKDILHRVLTRSDDEKTSDEDRRRSSVKRNSKRQRSRSHDRHESSRSRHSANRRRHSQRRSDSEDRGKSHHVLQSPFEVTIYTQAVAKEQDTSGNSSDLSLSGQELAKLNLSDQSISDFIEDCASIADSDRRRRVSTHSESRRFKMPTPEVKIRKGNGFRITREEKTR